MSKFTISSFIDKALSYEGYCEKKSNSKLDDFTANIGTANYTRFNRDYGKYMGVGENYWQGQPWCAMFVSTILVETLDGDVKTAKEMLGGDLFASCTAGYNRLKKLNRTFTTPKVGDIIYYCNVNDRTDMYHTGIVYNVDATRVYTIEGNTTTNSGVVANGGGVARKSYLLTYNKIGGYGRLIGADEAAEEVVEQNPVVSKPSTSNPNQYIVTANSRLRVRSGPGTNYSAINYLSKDTVVTITRFSNGWGFVTNLGGWVSMNYLKSYSTSSTTKYKVTADKGLNVRNGAGTSYSIKKALPKGTIIEISKISNGWGYVSDLKGWVSMSYVAKV